MILAIRTVKNALEKAKGNSLKTWSARGATALAIGSIIERVLRLARNVILARLLAPNEFGLVAIVIAASMVFEAFNEVSYTLNYLESHKMMRSYFLFSLRCLNFERTVPQQDWLWISNEHASMKTQGWCCQCLRGLKWCFDLSVQPTGTESN